jgi:hypothetical protein
MVTDEVFSLPLNFLSFFRAILTTIHRKIISVPKGAPGDGGGIGMFATETRINALREQLHNLSEDLY